MANKRSPLVVALALGISLLGISLYWSLTVDKRIDAQPRHESTPPPEPPKFFGGSKSLVIQLPDGERAVTFNMAHDQYDRNWMRPGKEASVALRADSSAVPRIIARGAKILSLARIESTGATPAARPSWQVTILVSAADAASLERERVSGAWVLVPNDP